MDETPNLKLPYILAAQAQKHVTHNEAIRALDAVVQLMVLDRDLGAPPGSPANGDRYIVAATPTGAWSGQAGRVAAFQDGAWVFFSPREGWVAWVADEDILVAWNGTAWVTAGGGGSSISLNPATGGLIGVNATADATNRLAVSSPNTLLNHDGSDHRLKINKAATANTASVLFQTGFSGRAEFGLAGDDDWRVKVSPNGTTWHDAIVVNRNNGSVSFPNTTLSGGREVLTAPRTYFVRTDGSDSNNGLANTAAGAFLTVQKAIDVAAALDSSIYDVTIQIANGTYNTGRGLIAKTMVGAGRVIIRGDDTTPANVILLANDNSGLIEGLAVRGIPTVYEIRGVRMTAATGGGSHRCLEADAGGTLEFRNIDFGPGWTWHVRADAFGVNTAIGNYTISAGAASHLVSISGFVRVQGRAITLTGTPNFPTAYAYAYQLGAVIGNACTFSGAATGIRYRAELNGVVNASGGGPDYFPGSTGGNTFTGGQYLA